jgi:colanic acid biosynthesis glycosyl transferase WcaI
VLAMSPPLTLGGAGWLAARRWGVPFVFNIQDVFPDVAVELGAITNPRVIQLASWLERWSYRRSDAVTVLSEDLRDNLVTKIRGTVPDATDRIRVIPNFVDTERIAPRDPEDGTYRSEYGLTGKRVVMYAGNVGFSQSLDLVIEAARSLGERTDTRDVVFVVNGGGSARAQLVDQAADLDNVVFVDFQPAERLPEVLAAADIHVVPLRRGLARSSVPSKTYSILAAGRPVVAAIDAGTEIPRLLAASGGGLAVAPDDRDAFCAAATTLLDDRTAAADMGRRGRDWVLAAASPQAVAASYESLIRSLAARQ